MYILKKQMKEQYTFKINEKSSNINKRDKLEINRKLRKYYYKQADST